MRLFSSFSYNEARRLLFRAPVVATALLEAFIQGDAFVAPVNEMEDTLLLEAFILAL